MSGHYLYRINRNSNVPMSSSASSNCITCVGMWAWRGGLGEGAGEWLVRNGAVDSKHGTGVEGSLHRWARATFFWVRNHNSATWRKNIRNRNSATFKEMLLRNRNSATPQSQFFLKSTTSSPQLESFNSAIFGTFSAVESGRFMGKKSEVENLVLLSL